MSHILQAREKLLSIATDKFLCCGSPRVLVVAPGPTVRGGIASVVLSHQATATWTQFNCRWLNTCSDRSTLHKVISALRAYLATPAAVLRADVVHLHLAADTSVIRKLPIAWFAAAMRKPVILHFHAAGADSLFDRTPSSALTALRSRATLVIVLSAYWKAEFARRWPEVPTAIVPNPVSCREVKAIKRPGAILFLGKLDRRKGYDLLLRALPAIVREFPEAQLWLAGHGELENAKALAQELGVQSSVRLWGWVSGAAKQVLLDESEILCLPSFAEGVPMAVLEGMANGLPVVTTPVGGIPDVITDGRNGILLPVGDSAAISSAVIELLRDPEKRRRLGAAGQETVRNLCSLDRVGALLADLYRNVVSATAKPKPNRTDFRAPSVDHGEAAMIGSTARSSNPISERIPE